MYGDVEVEYHAEHEVKFMFSVTLTSKEANPDTAG